MLVTWLFLGNTTLIGYIDTDDALDRPIIGIVEYVSVLLEFLLDDGRCSFDAAHPRDSIRAMVMQVV